MGVDLGSQVRAEGCRKIRRRQQVYLFVLATSLPAALLAHYLVGGNAPVISVVAWIGVIAAASASLSRSRCPACGERFHYAIRDGSPSWNAFSRECLHCGADLRTME